jgi:hypothetical protein
MSTLLHPAEGHGRKRSTVTHLSETVHTAILKSRGVMMSSEVYAAHAALSEMPTKRQSICMNATSHWHISGTSPSGQTDKRKRNK